MNAGRQIRIPWARPRFWGREEEYVLDALRSTWISGGPYVDRLEEMVTDLSGSRYATSAANGTAAIHMAFLALDLAAGDEVVVPAFCFQAAANIGLHMGLEPVFADVDPDTWCLSAEAVAEVLTARTRCIVAVHTYGNVCDMDPLAALAGRRGIPLVEDAAEAFGSTYAGRFAGSMGTVGTFSFQATKTVTSGEGGMVVTSDAAIHDKLDLFRNHGMRTKRYWHEVAGHNFRLTNLQAALVCAQIEAFDRIVAERERLHRSYVDRLSGAEGIRLQHVTDKAQAVVWAVAARLDGSVYTGGRDAVIAALAGAGIETRPGFYSVSDMPLYSAPRLPVSTGLSENVISLPTWAGLPESDIDEICGLLLEARG